MSKRLFNVIIMMILICTLSVTTNNISYAYNENDNTETTEVTYLENYNKMCNLDLMLNPKNNLSISFEDNDITISAISLIDTKTQIQEQQEVTIEYDNTIAYASTNVISPYEGYITEYMDLSNRTNITVDQMRVIIERYTKNHPNSKFIGMEQAFIDAANQTGLDPIFLFSLAGHESGWDVSDLHGTKNNPYSINMTDENPSGGYTMGDSFYNGIINGAQWIKDNYYDNGYTTLHSMIYGGRQYSSTADHWINEIRSIMNKCYSLIF